MDEQHFQTGGKRLPEANANGQDGASSSVTSEKRATRSTTKKDEQQGGRADPRGPGRGRGGVRGQVRGGRGGGVPAGKRLRSPGPELTKKKKGRKAAASQQDPSMVEQLRAASLQSNVAAENEQPDAGSDKDGPPTAGQCSAEEQEENVYWDRIYQERNTRSVEIKKEVVQTRREINFVISSSGKVDKLMKEDQLLRPP